MAESDVETCNNDIKPTFSLLHTSILTLNSCKDLKNSDGGKSKIFVKVKRACSTRPQVSWKWGFLALIEIES